VAPDRLFSLEEAQALLDGGLREQAERMVALRREWKPLQRRWQGVVMAVASNGGGLDMAATEALRRRLESLTDDLNEIIRSITEQGVQVKDVDQGLLDFPAVVEGEDALLCWHVGEEKIAFWHSPEDGFAGRRPL
jgi:hypothetical protein